MVRQMDMMTCDDHVMVRQMTCDHIHVRQMTCDDHVMVRQMDMMTYVMIM